MITTRLGSIVVVVVAAAFIAGCTSSRFGGLNTRPAPLPAAPSGTVTGGQLPPPSAPQGQGDFPNAPTGPNTATDVGAFPNPDGTNPDPNAIDGQPGTGVDGATPGAQASAGPVSRDAMVGAWRVSTQGSSCQMFMALTKWSTGFRAASRGCPGDAATISSWNVSGNQVVLSDSGGNRVATLFSTGEGRFDGQTTGGQAISLAR